MKKIIIIFFAFMMVSASGFTRDDNGSEGGVEEELSGLLEDFNSLKNELAGAHAEYRRLKGEYAQSTRDAQEKLSSLQAERAALAEELTQVRQGRETLKLQQQQAQSMIAEKERALAESARAREDLLLRMKDVEGKLYALQTAHDAARVQLEKAALDAGDKEKTLAGLAAERQRLEGALKDMGVKLDQAAAEKTVLMTQLDAYKVKEAGWQQRASQLAAVIAEKEKILTDLAGAKDQSVAKIKEHEMRLAALDSQKTALQARVKELEEKNTQTSSSYTQLRSQLDEAKVKIDALNAQNVQYDLAIKNKEALIAAAEKDKQAGAVAARELQLRLDQFLSEKTMLEGKLAAYMTKEAGWQQRASQLTAVIAEKEKAIADTTQALGQTGSRLKELEGKIASLELAKEAQVNQLKDAQLREETLRMQIQKLEASIQEKDRMLADLNQGAQVNGIQLKGVEAQLAQISGERQELQNQIKQLTGVIEEKTKIIAGLTEDYKRSSSQNRDYEIKVAQLSHERTGLQNQFAQLNNLMQQKMKAIAALQGQYDELAKKQEATLNQLRQGDIALNTLQSEKITLASRLKEYELKEQEWMGKNEQMAVAIDMKEKNIKDLLALQQNYQAQLRDAENQRAGAQEKNNILFKDNKLLKQKVDLYAGRLSKMAVLKDRLLKENSVLHYNLGVFYLQRQDYNEAIVEFEKVLELSPDDAATHYNLGLIYSEYLDNKPKAIAHFKRYLTLDPKDKDADRARKYILTWETWQDERPETH